MPPAALHAGLALDALRPVYLLVGDEVYFRDQFRAALLALIPGELRDYSLFDEDLATTPLGDILDRARNPSLMAGLQVYFIRNAKELYGRGAKSDGTESAAGPGGKKAPASKKKHGDFPDNVARFAAEAGRTSPPPAVLVFIADHLHLPADRQRVSLEDKGRLQRLDATFGPIAATIQCGRVPEAQAVALARQLAAEQGAELPPEAARYLVELLDGNLGLMRREIEKLVHHARPETRIERAAIERLVAASQLGSSYDLALRIAAGDRGRALEILDALWAEEGDAQAIPLLFQLSRAFKMALLVRQSGGGEIRDPRAIYNVLPDGLRPPTFAADAILKISARMPEAKLKQSLRLLHAADDALRKSAPSPRLLFEQFIFAIAGG